LETGLSFFFTLAGNGYISVLRKWRDFCFPRASYGSRLGPFTAHYCHSVVYFSQLSLPVNGTLFIIPVATCRVAGKRGFSTSGFFPWVMLAGNLFIVTLF